MPRLLSRILLSPSLTESLLLLAQKEAFRGETKEVLHAAQGRKLRGAGDWGLGKMPDLVVILGDRAVG